METRPLNSTGHSQQDPTLVRAMRGLQEELHSVLTTYGEASNRQLTDMIIAVERLSWQMYAAQNLLAAEADERTTGRPSAEALSNEYGCGTTHEYLQRCAGMSQREAGARIRLGKSLSPQKALTGASISADLPYLGVAARAGAISPENTKTISRMLNRVSWLKGDKRQAAEKHLVEAATGIDFGTGTISRIAADQEGSAAMNPLVFYADRGLLDPLSAVGLELDDNDKAADGEPLEVFPSPAQNADSIATMTQLWHQYLDQDGTLPDEKETLNQRGVNLGRPRNGLIPIHGHLVPEVAGLLDNMMSAINSPRNQKTGNDDATSKTDTQETQNSGLEKLENKTGLWPDGPDIEGRTPAHKRHDALAAIINMASTAADMPSHGGAPITVLVETTQEALETGGASWMLGPGSDTTLLTPQAVGHAACSGSLQYYAKNSTGRLVALGTKQRIFNANQRKAIIARDGGCVIPGCATPPTWLEIHHVQPHSQGGETHTDNGVALCWYHHRTLDTNGWQIRMNRGAPEIKAPRWIDPRQKWRKPKPPAKPPTHQQLSPWAQPAITPAPKANTPFTGPDTSKKADPPPNTSHPPPK